MKYILIFLILYIVFSCKFDNKYCVSNVNWDNLDTCVDKALLDSYIKDINLTDTNKINGNLKFAIKLIQDTLREANEIYIHYYINSIKLQDSVIFISIKHIDSYVYDYVLNGNPPSIIGNISGKDRFYTISVLSRKIIDENLYQ